MRRRIAVAAVAAALPLVLALSPAMGEEGPSGCLSILVVVDGETTVDEEHCLPPEDGGGLPEVPGLPGLPEDPTLPELPGLPGPPEVPQLPGVPGLPDLPA